MNGKRAVLIALGFFTVPGVSALEPPTRAEVEAYLRDGSLTGRLHNALALGNHLPDPALVLDLRERLLRAGRGESGRSALRDAGSAALPPGRRGLPTKGQVRVFALLIDFPDHPAGQSRDLIHDRLFGNGDIDWPRESLRNYYRRSSYGLLEIGGATLGWYRAGYARSTMPLTVAAREKLIKEALADFDARGHDFAPYDNDGNGAIDYFIVIWTGPDNGWANFWWGYQTSFADSTFRLDGKSFYQTKYSWQWESRPVGGPFYPYVVIHETGHALGLPDYYDYDAAVGPRGGVGGLDMMDANRGDHNAFSKMLLDWVAPQVFNHGTGAFFLSPSAAAPEALVLMPEYRVDRPFDEFFVVQNRWRTGNDEKLPGDGLLIWHVDARLNAAGTNFLYNNSYSSHKLLRLMEADGQEHIERGYAATAADYYVAGRELRPAGVPPSGRYDGTETGISVASISEAAPTMTFAADIHYTLRSPGSAAVRRIESDYIFYREFIDQISWQPDVSYRTEITGYRILKRPSATEGGFVLLVEVPGTTLSYDHRGLTGNDAFVYRITAVDRNGVESLPAEVKQ